MLWSSTIHLIFDICFNFLIKSTEHRMYQNSCSKMSTHLGMFIRF